VVNKHDLERLALPEGSQEGIMVKRLDHIAIAVHNLEEAAKFYRDMLGLQLENVEVVKEQKTKVGFFPIGETNNEPDFCCYLVILFIDYLLKDLVVPIEHELALRRART